MSAAVFVSTLGMIVSLGAIMAIGVVGGALLFICERIAAKRRPSH